LVPTSLQNGGQSALPDAPAFGHLFAGLVQLADWLGSDTDFFPYPEKKQGTGIEELLP
jgi:CRISPR-associated endonuclease/helicase Cas3